MEISHASHRHRLILKDAKCPYYCWGCDQLGFGQSYTCKKGCNFFLHKQCGKPKKEIEYPFSKTCVLKFRDGGSGVGSACVACGKTIKRFHYRCLCTSKKRNLHPSCVGNKKTLDAAYGLTLHLQKAAASKCLHCGKKDLWSKVHGWAYVSSCGTYCYHVTCVKDIINKNWRNGFITGKSDPFATIKQHFLEDKERMHKLTVAQKKGRPILKHAEAVLSVIFNLLTGNPFGLIGAARSFFRPQIHAFFFANQD